MESVMYTVSYSNLRHAPWISHLNKIIITSLLEFLFGQN